MKYRNSFRLAGLLFLPGCLLAQQAPGWRHQGSLGEDTGGAPAWWGGGVWSGGGQGPSTTLVDSLGMGNSITGSGFHLEGGFRKGNWDFAAEGLGGRKAEGGSFLTLYRAHAWWRGKSGWQAGFEREPLVWGYGLNGGYLLGEASRPFPRLRLESPYRAVSFFRIPLGQWGFQAFMGRLENHRALSPSIQDASWRTRAMALQGDPQAPLLAGYRLQARFGSRVDFYLNYLNLWSGTLNGVGMTQGYGAGDYLTSMFGLKDTLAEASHDPAHPMEVTPYKNRARSASAIDWGIRVETPVLARALGAEKARLYLSRGSKSAAWPLGVFIKNPPKYLAKDVSADLRNLFTGKFGFGWNYDARYALPSELNPNDAVGALISWRRVRLGLEYLDTSNPDDQGHRTFAHSQYLTGFYYHGDPLGNALAGEARVTSARIEVDLAPGGTLVTWVHYGIRPFRDDRELWLEDHPGFLPASDRIFGLQQALRLGLSRGLTLDLGAAWERHGASGYVKGVRGNGFRWFTNLGYRFPK